MSSTDYKKNQFKKYKLHLETKQLEYATKVSADYRLYTIKETDYDKIQFMKLNKLEELSKIYDEVLYLDFDVIPQTDVNFFEYFDMNKINAYSMSRTPGANELKWKFQANDWDRMNVYAKTCAKKSMLILENMSGNDTMINTGVVGGNRKAIQNLNFSKRLPEAYKVFEESCIDNLYPEEISRSWRPNNEVFISWMIEKYNVPYTNIGMAWNFMLDDYAPRGGESSHFLHHIKKEFDITFGEIDEMES